MRKIVYRKAVLRKLFTMHFQLAMCCAVCCVSMRSVPVNLIANEKFFANLHVNVYLNTVHTLTTVVNAEKFVTEKVPCF